MLPFHPHASWHQRVARLAALLALALGLWAGPGLAAPPATTAAGFPDLSVSLSPAGASALGLKAGGPASLSRIPAEALLVVVMSYFCPPCHKEVPRLKELERRIRERALTGRIRLVGLAAGDDQAQVERFLAQHGGLPFPLLPDPALAAHKRLGSPVVPSLYAVASRGGKLSLLSLRQGEFTEDPDTFLDALLRALPPRRGAAPGARAQ